jgi:transposase
MVLANRGYDAGWIRSHLSTARHVGQSPAACFSLTSIARTRIERFFNKIKHCRRIATRYGKLAANDQAVVQLDPPLAHDLTLQSILMLRASGL